MVDLTKYGLTNDFKKVNQSGGSYVTAGFYNPVTGDYKSVCVRDYDYSDCSRDIDELYYLSIDETARRMWQHANGRLLVGDVVRVVKGRKIPHGTIATINQIKPIYDKYKRWIDDYAIFTDGTKTSIFNCELVTEKGDF